MLEYLIGDDVVNKDDRIAVGVSGGADSMLLLWALLDKKRQIGFYLEVININHHIRGVESDRDSSFVEEFCKKHKIDYKIIDVDVLKLKKDEKKSIEESARIARYNAFKKVMKADRLNKLFLAHHKNDQAETVLMHIFRGAGISGAVGIKNDLVICRPLLNLKKSEILNIANEHGIEFVEDSTNADSNYTRNYLRNVVIPEIEKIYPNVVDAICSFSKRCDEAQDFILSKIDDSLIKKCEDYILLNDKAFKENKVLVREYIKRAFEKLGVFSDIETKHYKLVYELSFQDVNKEISLPHDVVAKRTYLGVKLFIRNETCENLDVYEFVKNGEIDFRGKFKIVTRVISMDEVVYGEGALFVDLNKVSNKAVWRTRRLGDKFSKIGTGSKKLNDYLTNKKIDSDVRDFIPLLATDDNVLVVLGDDICENVKIDSNTDEVVKITFERLWFHFHWQNNRN